MLRKGSKVTLNVSDTTKRVATFLKKQIMRSYKNELEAIANDLLTQNAEAEKKITPEVIFRVVKCVETYEPDAWF